MPEDNLSIMLGLGLAAGSLADYFSFKQQGKSNGAIKGEIGLGLAEMLGDFTYAFLDDKSLKKWNLKESVMKMPEERKYALKVIGKRVKSNNPDTPEEQKGFDYLIAYLRYLNNIKSEDENKRKEAYEKLHEFFDVVARIAEREANAIPKEKL